jgi:hypothetical protein
VLQSRRSGATKLVTHDLLFKFRWPSRRSVLGVGVNPTGDGNDAITATTQRRRGIPTLASKYPEETQRRCS